MKKLTLFYVADIHALLKPYIPDVEATDSVIVELIKLNMSVFNSSNKFFIKHIMLIPRNYLLTLCMLAPFTLLGQSQIPYDIPTPNTASLGKYGCVPVSLYTGVPDISIPLYDLTVRNVTLPLRLRYDASGLQINSLPGWLGHNWSLEAGGVITRTVKGRFDDYIVTNPQYLHEYGHTFDSRLFAQYYLFTIGIPSLLSAMTSKEINTPPFSTHQEYWTEKRANRWAKRYFGKYYGVNWDTDIYNNYSYEKLYPTY